MDSGRTTSQEYWEAVHAPQPRMSLPSDVLVSTQNTKRLLRRYVRPGMEVLEIGCAPGKLLSFLASRLRARIHGLDYSTAGVDCCHKLLRHLRLRGDIRCEDLFQTTFPPASFDLVYSLGVVEHFDDPSDVIDRHVQFLRPGGIALVAVPRYSGLYLDLQSRFDPENLKLHNLRVMQADVLQAAAPADPPYVSRVFPWGRADFGLINIDKRMSRMTARLLWLSLNCLSWFQPMDIPPLCPMLILEVVRRGSA